MLLPTPHLPTLPARHTVGCSSQGSSQPDLPWGSPSHWNTFFILAPERPSSICLPTALASPPQSVVLVPPTPQSPTGLECFLFSEVFLITVPYINLPPAVPHLSSLFSCSLQHLPSSGTLQVLIILFFCLCPPRLERKLPEGRGRCLFCPLPCPQCTGGGPAQY